MLVHGYSHNFKQNVVAVECRLAIFNITVDEKLSLDSTTAYCILLFYGV
jgi:hypothetical protein